MLWAFNEEHLSLLQSWIAADLRERPTGPSHSNCSLARRLPQGMNPPNTATKCYAPAYSSRNATAGSIHAARNTGASVATIAAPPKIATADP